VATYVLVPGGGHGGWCYQSVAQMLRNKGHFVYTPTLTGLGERFHLLRPDVGLDVHIRDVAALMVFENLYDVILVGHGYGGMVITGAADCQLARVGHLVYLDGAVPVHDQSLADVAAGPIAALRRDVETINGVELCLFPTADLLPYWGVTDPAVLEWMMTRLTPHPWKSFLDPLKLANEGAVRAIPSSHLISRLAAMGWDLDALTDLARGRVWTRDTGHDMMLTEPGWVADRLAATAEWMPAHRIG
jgi:pimeloyl-ACP methyl ester carboxylesterase